jgi:8-oxo-dGTP diphosphatase
VPDYDASAFPPFAVTVDLVVFTVRDRRLQVLLVRRGVAPFQGRWALPGGFVHVDEDLHEAAVRELAEETGLTLRDVHLEQLATYGAPKRDPRMRVVSVAWLVLAPDLPTPMAGTDAVDASWRPVDDVLARGRLSFDHAQIIGDGLERARAKLEYSSLGASFCREEFTVAELREVYETVWGVQLDPRNFHRKVTGTPGFLVETDETTTRGGGRPAMLYRAQDAVLNPPILRI